MPFNKPSSAHEPRIPRGEGKDRADLGMSGKFARNASGKVKKSNRNKHCFTVTRRNGGKKKNRRYVALKNGKVGQGMTCFGHKSVQGGTWRDHFVDFIGRCR